MLKKLMNKRNLAALIFLMSATFACYGDDPIDREDHVLSDGKLDITEVGAVVATAQNHLKMLTKAAVEGAQKELEEAAIFRPMAFMLMKSSGEVKKMKLGEEGENAPSDIKVVLYRAGLKSLARHGEIHAAAIAYPGTLEKSGETVRIMAVEHEHRLGVSGIKLIPIIQEDGKARFGKPMSQEKPFLIFYDGKEKGGQS